MNLIRFLLAMAVIGASLLPIDDAAAQSPPAGSMQGRYYLAALENNQLVLKGWACSTESTTPVNIMVFAGGPSGVGSFIGWGTADQLDSRPAFDHDIATRCRNPITPAYTPHHYKITLPQQVIEDFHGQQLYVYATCTAVAYPACSTLELIASDLPWYNTPHLPYLFSKGTNPPGWSDGINYFQEWGCTSNTGITHLAKLNIAPLGSHAIAAHKDSLFADFTEQPNGPVIYFTGSTFMGNPTFYLERAVFNGTNWVITEHEFHRGNNGGISSQDGTRGDYIVNDYTNPSWGPASHRPGNRSVIPGVSDTHTVPAAACGTNCDTYSFGYPLWGSGPNGLTTVQKQAGNPSQCVHMNPTLRNFGPDGRPRSMIACLFRGDSANACDVPAAVRDPALNAASSGFFEYDYEDGIGWQIKRQISIGTCLNPAGTNAVRATNLLLLNHWEGLVQTYDLSTGVKQNALDCRAKDVTFSETTGTASTFYIQVDPPGPKYGTAVGLFPGVWVHDIYVAF